MSDFSREIIKVAKLAAIKIDDDEKKKYSEELGIILDMINELHTVDTDNVEPLRSVASGNTTLRADIACQAPKENILASAKHIKYDYFVVPKFVE